MSEQQLRIHTSSTSPLLRKACARVLVDEHYPQAWSDLTPRIYTDWLSKFETKTWLPFIWTLNDELVGFQWAHDLAFGPDGGIVWMGGSVFKGFRGKKYYDLRMEAWGMVRASLEEQGYSSLLGASIVGNQGAYAFITACGYTAVGVYKEWMLNQGRLVDAVLYTLRPQDRNILWLLAEHRAQEARKRYAEVTAQH